MEQQVKPPREKPTFRDFQWVPAALLLIQLPGNAPGKSAEQALNAQAPPTYTGHPGLWPGPALTVGIWDMNQQICLFAFPIEKENKLVKN